MRLLINGGGSTQELNLTMLKLNNILNSNKPILYIPLAMDEEIIPYDSCYGWFKEQLINVSVKDFVMVRSFKELNEKDMEDYSAIFIGGGNTYKLLKGLKEGSAFNKIKKYIENNGIVIGCSAGAVILGKDIDIISAMDENNVNFNDTAGFDVLNGASIFPHYINLKSKLTEEENKKMIDMYTKHIIEYSQKKGLVYAIPEEDTIFVNEDEIIVIGTEPYYMVINGQLKVFSSVQEKNNYESSEKCGVETINNLDKGKRYKNNR